MTGMWRTPTSRGIIYHGVAVRVFCLLGCLGMVSSSVAAVAVVILGQVPAGEVLPVALVILVLGSAYFRVGFMPQVVLSPDLASLRVTTALRRETIAMSDVRSFTSDEYLRITMTDGRTFTMWTLQRANLTRWRGTESNGDRVARELEFVRTHRALPSVAIA